MFEARDDGQYRIMTDRKKYETRITSGEFNINCRTTRRNEKKEMRRATNMWMNFFFFRGLLQGISME